MFRVREVLRRDSVFVQQVTRQVTTTGGRVIYDVPGDVGQLESDAEVGGATQDGRVLNAHDVGHHDADDARDETRAKKPKAATTKSDAARRIQPGTRALSDGRRACVVVAWNIAGLRSFYDKSLERLEALVREEDPDVNRSEFTPRSAPSSST